MCLIHTIKAETRLDNSWLRNIHGKNPDGIGAMLIEDGRAVMKKYVPKNLRRALRWYRREVEGRTGVVHWRYATHGLVDFDNCHPYAVLSKEEDGIDMWCMHNGVMDEYDLHTHLDDVTQGGNRYPYMKHTYGVEKDTMSDTFHFIRVVLKPLVKDDPKVLRNPVVRAMLGNLIGHGNKLVIMDSDAEMHVINEQEFVNWPAYDLICSNTYAWAYSARACASLHDYVEPVKLAGVKGDPRLYMLNTPPAVVPPPTVSALQTRLDYEWPSGDEDIVLPDEHDTLADNQNWLSCKRRADEFWDELNLVYPQVAEELTGLDIAEFLYKYTEQELASQIVKLAHDEMTVMEFVDTIFDGIRA